MSVFEFRYMIENHTPFWMPFAFAAIVVIIFAIFTVRYK